MRQRIWTFRIETGSGGETVLPRGELSYTTSFKLFQPDPGWRDHSDFREVDPLDFGWIYHEP